MLNSLLFLYFNFETWAGISENQFDQFPVLDTFSLRLSTNIQFLTCILIDWIFT